jgi:hypothetical protein
MIRLIIRNILLVVGFVSLGTIVAKGQQTFKTIWKTYDVGWIIHEYNYNYIHSDSVHLYLLDSATTYVSKDSLVTMTVATRYRDKSLYKTINYLNPAKLVIKTEDIKDEVLQEVDEWVYDDKNRKVQHHKDSKLNGNKYRKKYEYKTDSKTGGSEAIESSYYNDRIEFYTKMYYDKQHVLYKEVRLNDNNRDVIHVENFYYGENGRLKERTVFFPEFKVTKKFQEQAGDIPAKCYAFKAVGVPERATLGTKIAYMKKVLLKNQVSIADPACKEFELTFTNNTTCAITVATTKVNNGKTVRFRFKEKIK